ncbi:glycosyltransferase [Sporolactobacillus nakayamae]|uniref:Glycosyltransferase involved in cell wall bisynthesis n=1 Tax=Sporolactobacillus nakayamae TaxID=269670 RepID=A0A1I2W1G0_9BACL|nr:glycosyltransferase [Sporolactobacillus nakayamae]SFG94519.1 Glycosyltransferase involved in cell wall bisynthesis [Sporolactobacillus nakayamae]
MKILFASHTFIGSTFVVGSHHLANTFAKMGHEVLHISTPITPLHVLNIRNDEIKKRFKLCLSKNKYIGNPKNIVPFKLIPSRFLLFDNKLFKLKLRRILKKTEFLSIDVLFIDEPTFYPICDIVHCNSIIYRPTDIYSKMRNNIKLDILEKRILKKSRSFIATSEPVYKHIRNLNKSVQGKIIENGVDVSHFMQTFDVPDAYKSISGLKIIYVGALDKRIDIDAFLVLARNFPKISIIVVGPITKDKREVLHRYSNIFILGSIDYKLLPAYLQNADIGLLPLNDDPSNNGRSPMKLYEYAASGLIPISRYTDELSRRNRKQQFLYLYKNYNELISYIKLVLNFGTDELLSRKIALKNISQNKSWNKIAISIIKDLSDRCE